QLPARAVILGSILSHRTDCFVPVRDCPSARAVRNWFPVRARSPRRCTMFRLASIRRMLPPSLTRLAWGALGICSMAVIVAVSAGFEPTDAAKKSPTPAEDNGVGKPAEAPAGFDNKTNGFEDQAAFDKDRDSFEEVE